MTRQSKLIILVVYLLLLTVVMLTYRLNRSTKIKTLRAQLSAKQAETSRQRAGEAEMQRVAKLIPTQPKIAQFVEELYRCARESGLKQHEVVTEGAGSSGTARPGNTATGAVAKQRIKITASGSFRSIAEYFRRVQNIERLNRITAFKLVPDKEQVVCTINIELYSLPEKK